MSAGLAALEAALGTASLAQLERALRDLEPDGLDLDRRLAALGGARWVGDDLADAPGAHASLFLLPAGGAIPLHDHPGMTVLMRVLRGRARVRAWDWVGGPPRGDEVARARPVLDVEVGAGDPVVWVRPDQANVHRIDASAACAFVDVLVPWYDDDRPCSYYEPAPGGLRRVGREA